MVIIKPGSPFYFLYVPIWVIMVMVKISFGQHSSGENAYDHIYKHLSIKDSNPVNCKTLQYGVNKEYLLNIKTFFDILLKIVPLRVVRLLLL